MDKRRYDRLKSDFNVRIKHIDRKTGLSDIITAKSVNVSASGVLFTVSKHFRVKSVINIKFLKPNSLDFFEVDAKIIRITESSEKGHYDIAIQFLNLSEEEEKKLNYFLFVDGEE